MRTGGIFAAAIAAAPLLASGCGRDAESRLACADRLSIHFKQGGAELNLDAVNKVLRTAETLKGCQGARATVTGHSGRGEPQALGDTRAANVAAVLAKSGVDGRRIRVTGDDAGPPGSAEPDNRYVSISWK